MSSKKNYLVDEGCCEDSGKGRQGQGNCGRQSQGNCGNMRRLGAAGNAVRLLVIP